MNILVMLSNMIFYYKLKQAIWMNVGKIFHHKHDTKT